MTSIDIYSILSSKPHNPHYLKRYYKFILWCDQVNSTKTKEELGYAEKHHICPKAKDLFSEYEYFKKNPWNKIVLTGRQHYIAHWILWKVYGQSQSQAFWQMTNKLQIKSSKVYNSIKNDRNIVQSQCMTGKKRGPHSEETKAKIRNSLSGRDGRPHTHRTLSQK